MTDENKKCIIFFEHWVADHENTKGVNTMDIIGLWELFVQSMNRLFAWLAFVLGGADFDPDYGQKD